MPSANSRYGIARTARGQANSVASLILRRSATRHFQYVNWKKIRLELADTREHPRGSVSRGYLIYAPLDESGVVDEQALARTPARAVVRRFWSTEPDEKGHLVRANGHWALRCGGKSDRLIRTGAPSFQLGRLIDVTDPDEGSMPFRVASISRLGQEVLPS